MMFERVLITGGAGFVGSHLALSLRRSFPGTEVVALDNLHRRGSEFNLDRLREAGVHFVHGDVRCPEDLEGLPDFDLLIDSAAEPSVQAGVKDSPKCVLHTNLLGTIQCLELARQRNAAFLFLSTSRVYPIERLNAIPYFEDESRFRWQPGPADCGCSLAGINEAFSLDGPRSYYGASKLASEIVLQEYVHHSGMQALINRCGVLAGPGQMGKTDQGVTTLWVARHYSRKPLSYIGFGGKGNQVRDILHVEDLCSLVVQQLQRMDLWDGRVYNVGGGLSASVSLRELTELCEQVTGNQTVIEPHPETSGVDVRIYITDSTRVRTDFSWTPQYSPIETVGAIHTWIRQNERQLRGVLAL
jgi:CDP-paratose 2-epimerase